ncbi:snare-like protein [Neoconidiobolus thromboides FSU 785]|nr:snare-like protein [Neoconidiobolus thromboides FSU 785]
MVYLLSIINQEGIERYNKLFQPVIFKKAEEYNQFKDTLFDILSNREEYEGPIFEFHNTENMIVYKKFASLYFMAYINPKENEFEVLDILNHIMETLSISFESFCELDIIYHLDKVNLIISEFFNINGEIQATDPIQILTSIEQFEE